MFPFPVTFKVPKIQAEVPNSYRFCLLHQLYYTKGLKFP